MQFRLKTVVTCVLPVALAMPSIAVAQSQLSEQPGASSPDTNAGSPAAFSSEQQSPIVGESSSSLRVDMYAWIWLVGFDGNVGAGGLTSEVDASFGDVLDASDSIFAFAGRLEVGYGKIAGFLDGMYSDLGADDHRSPDGATRFDIEMQQGLLDFGMMYRVVDVEPSGDGAPHKPDLTLDLYAGGRFNALELTLDPVGADAGSRSRSWVDPIVGAKLVLPLAERWRFEVNGDIGGFGVESDLTWSGTAVFGLDFDLFGLPATVLAGYRAIGWDYSEGGDNNDFIYDIIQHGPILGLSVRF